MLLSNRGKFITFEGVDGCGKSTQSRKLYEYLQSQNIPVDLTHEVGGTITAEKMRDILVHEDLFPQSELLLIMAARFEHLHKRIIPALDKGIWVICDRFVDSTACYQGNNSAESDYIYKLHNELVSPLMPDMTFFLDVEPNRALIRAKQRGNNNKFEAKNYKFHKKVFQRFQDISNKFPSRITKIDATFLTIGEIHDIIISVLDRYLLKIN